MNSRNYGCRITEDLVICGNKALVMENDKVRVTFLVDKGTDIIEFLYKPQDIDFMWRSPVPLHKRADFIGTTGDSFNNYLDHYEGGWQEILPNGGPECTYKGAKLGMHGELCNIPWKYEVLEDCENEIIVRFFTTLVRSPFKLDKYVRLRRGESLLYFEETLENLAKEEMELMWGQHPTLGQPFLSEACTIRTSAKTCFTYGEELDFEKQRIGLQTKGQWPYLLGRNGEMVDISKVPTAQNETADMLFLSDFEEEAWYEVYNSDLNLAFGMKWDKQLFPYVWMWLVCQGAYSYPWYGRTYNLALEPWTSYPGQGLEEAINNGSALKMQPRQKIQTSFSVYIKED